MPSFSVTDYVFFIFLILSSNVLAARPWLNEPDTGLLDFLSDNGTIPTAGELVPLDDIVTLPDFEWAAKTYMSPANFSYYRTGAAGEYGYRGNLEAFTSVKLRPRVLQGVVGVENTMNTTILGYNFSAPFFIAPAAKAGKAHPLAEINLVKGAYNGGILYIPSLFATLNISQIGAAKAPGQVTFQQLYVRGTNKSLDANLAAAEAAGSKAIVFSVDNAWEPSRSRSARWNDPAVNYDYPLHTWLLYDQIKNKTKLPVIPKGIQSWEDAVLAVEHGAPAIYISNHGARQIDTAQTTMEVLLEIYDNAPQVFNQTEVLADSGVRYGTDILKMLAMGVKAVGLGRSFMYSNIYGQDGVEHLIDLLKDEVIADAGNLGISDIQAMRGNTAIMNLTPLRNYLGSS